MINMWQAERKALDPWLIVTHCKSMRGVYINITTLHHECVTDETNACQSTS